MPTSLYSLEAFQKMVKEMIHEAVKEEMVMELDRLNLKELGGVQGSEESNFTQSSTGTSGTTPVTGTKPGVGTNPGNGDPANSVLVPGTNMNINQGLQAAAKEVNFKKKAELITKISTQLAGMKGVVTKENMDEPDLPGGQKVNTRKPMFPDLINRITNMVYYGDKSDEEILSDLGPEVASNPKMARWAKFIADMVRKGKDVMEESKKSK